MNQLQKEALQALLGQPVRWNCALARYTSFGIGGPAEALCLLENSQELAQLLALAAEHQLSWRVFGRGTNLLVRDEGLSGLTLLLGKGFQKIWHDENPGCMLVTAGAGCSLTRLSRYCQQAGLSGLEFAEGIPGSLGGALVMNAGAWGLQMADVVSDLTLVTAEGELHLSRKDLHFAYRRWLDAPQYLGRAVITAATMCLRADDPAAIGKRCQEYQRERQIRQPKGEASAGSFFRNPPGDSAGRLIEACGLKGRHLGAAKISEKHANFLVNTGGATAAEVLALMRLVQQTVRTEQGVELEPEVQIL